MTSGIGRRPGLTSKTLVSPHSHTGEDIVAGQVVARTEYLPPSLQSFVSAGSLVQELNANMAVTCVVPASGTVEVTLEAMVLGGSNRLSWGLREGSVDLADEVVVNSSTSGIIRERVSIILTGLTPGTHTLKWTQYGTRTTYVGVSSGNWTARMTVRSLPAGDGVTRRYGTLNGQAFRLFVPSGPSPRPLVLYSHGRGGDVMSLESVTYVSYLLLDDLLANGWMVATTDAHFDNFGNGDACTDFAALRNWVNNIYPVSDVVMWGESMGGLAALNAVSGIGSIPDMRGAMVFAGLSDLAAVYANATFTAGVNSAYGITGTAPNTYALKTAGFDPILQPDANYAGKRFMLAAAASDSVAPRAVHTDPMASKLTAAGATEVVVSTFSGSHSSPTRYDDPAPILAFLNRCVS